MNDSFFIDTNIFVYSVLLAEPQNRSLALNLIDRALSSAKGVISYQVVQEFLNVAIRHYAQPMSLAECEEYLSTVFGLF
jgi:predicted nucleic acid-binding protein